MFVSMVSCTMLVMAVAATICLMLFTLMCLAMGVALVPGSGAIFSGLLCLVLMSVMLLGPRRSGQ